MGDKNMVKCKVCNKDIAKGVKKCPHCGKDQRNFFMRHKILTGILVLVLIAAIGEAIGGDDGDSPKVVTKESEESKKPEESKEKVEEKAEQDSKETAEEAYQRILEEYTVKIKEATPGLIEEYHDEAKDNTDGLEGLAELSNKKVMVLAEINNDGVGEMAEVMLKKGSGSYDEYEEWAEQLMDVYMDEGAKITEAYMNSAK